MKVINADRIEIDSPFMSRTMLENALRMLDNYQPPAPEFSAGDIIESIHGTHGGTKFVVLEGSTRHALRNAYAVPADQDTLHFTNGSSSWSCQDPRKFRKVGSL